METDFKLEKINDDLFFECGHNELLAKRAWDTLDIRQEFVNDFSVFIAYCRSLARGQSKICRGHVVVSSGRT